jgi:hypothetical protein
MAHWIGKLNLENSTVIVSGKTKEETIREIGIMMTNRSRYMASTVENQLRVIHEQPMVAYGREGEELAKVFSCNCGSIKRHLERD